MHVNDPVGDMLTRIRNASRARHDKVVIPSSKLKLQIAQVLRDQGFIAECVQHDRKPQAEMTLVLKYGQDRHPAISGIKRVSKPGLRRYVSVREIPQVLSGLGIAILSTSRGVMGDHQARQEKLGGELICTVY